MDTLVELEKLYETKQFEKAINLARSSLRSVKDKKIKVELNKKLGRFYDQYAVATKHKVRKRELQKRALYYFRKLEKYNKFDALRGVGTVYHHKHNPRKALEYYRKARTLQPHNSLIYNDIGNAYKRLGIIERNSLFLKGAKTYYKRALQKTRSNELKISPLINLALLGKETGNAQEIKRYVSQALTIINRQRRPEKYEGWKNVLTNLLKIDKKQI